MLIFLISFLVNKMFIFSFFLSVLFASLPMWSLSIFGSFGGYDIEDLTIFSTFSIRLKSFLIAISMTSIAYVIYTFTNLSFAF